MSSQLSEEQTMIADFFKSLRAAYRFWLREMRYRAEKRRRANLYDPFNKEQK